MRNVIMLNESLCDAKVIKSNEISIEYYHGVEKKEI